MLGEALETNFLFVTQNVFFLVFTSAWRRDNIHKRRAGDGPGLRNRSKKKAVDREKEMMYNQFRH